MEGTHQDAAALAAQQVDAVWSMMLAQMTEGGATRQDIVQVTVQTVAAIVGTTTGELWPEGQAVPVDETQAQAILGGIVLALDNLS